MTIEPEVLTDETPVDHLPRADALAIFTDFQTQLEALKATAETLTVTDALQVKEMAAARECRLSLKKIRCAVETKRKELTEAALRQKQAIDDKARTLRLAIEPLEARMEAQEKFAELENSRIENERRTTRAEALFPYVTGPIAVDLGTMPEAEWTAMFTDFKTAHAERLAREQREAEEAAQRAKEAAEEQERIRVENERLRAEAEKREAEIAEERRRFAAEQEKAVAEARAEAEKIKAKAAAEVEASRLREQQEREIAADAERELSLRKEAEFKAAQEREQAALAPDKAKLIALAASFRAFALPTMTTDKGVAAIGEIAGLVEKLAVWCEKKAGAL